MNSENINSIKLCPFCESQMIICQDDNIINNEPYLECSTCGLKFKVEGFEKNPVEIKGN